MIKVSVDYSSSSGAASGDKIAKTSSVPFQYSMRSLLSFSALCGALAGAGSLIPRNLKSTRREAHFATPTSELLITGPEAEQPGIFLTIKRSAEGEQPGARIIEKYAKEACSAKARYLTGLRLNRPANSDSDFTVLENIESIGDRSISDCVQLTGLSLLISHLKLAV